MESLVVNNIVKMDWEEKKFIMLKRKGQMPGMANVKVLLFAAHTYETAKGKLDIFFDGLQVYVWGNDIYGSTEDMWDCEDVRLWYKDNGDYAFPTSCETFEPIINHEDRVNMQAVEHFGLADFMDDLWARHNDLSKYAETTEAQ